MKVANSIRSLHEANKGVVTKGNLYSIHIDMIVEPEGFNTRDYDRPEIVQHIRNLADAYKAGKVLAPLVVQVIDGKAELRDGFCRIRGARLAIAEGAEFTHLPVVPSTGDEIAQTMVILSSNQGVKLTPIEQAAVYARLIGFNLSETEIAKLAGKTVPHVTQYLTIHSMPLKLKKMIHEGTVAMSAVLKLYNEIGTKAVDVLESQLDIVTKQVNKEEDRKSSVKNDNQISLVGLQETDKEFPSAAEDSGNVDLNGLSESKAEVAIAEEQSKHDPKVKKVRVTQKNIDAARGYRERLQGISVKTVTETLGMLAEKISSSPNECCTITLSVEEVKQLLTAHKDILPPGYDPDQMHKPTIDNHGDDHSQLPTDTKTDNTNDRYREAIAVVIADQRASITHVQRKLKIGYNQASQLIETMESEGVVSKVQTDGSRIVLQSAM